MYLVWKQSDRQLFLDRIDNHTIVQLCKYFEIKSLDQLIEVVWEDEDNTQWDRAEMALSTSLSSVSVVGVAMAGNMSEYSLFYPTGHP